MKALTWLLALALAAPAGEPATSPSEEGEEAMPADEPGLAPGARARDEEAEDRAEDARIAAKAKELARNPPTAATLGVPLYPGARFDAELSAGMSASEEARYDVFLSADPVEKVTLFYEQKTGRKAERTPDGALIAVKGSSPWPDLGVTVQPNAFGGPGRAGMKSLITVRKGQEKK